MKLPTCFLKLNSRYNTGLDFLFGAILVTHNNFDLVIRFWRRFVRQSQAAAFGRYGYYETLENNGRTAKVEAKLIYDNGQEQRHSLVMVNERGGWPVRVSGIGHAFLGHVGQVA